MGVTRLKDLISAAEDDPDNMDKWFKLGKYATDRFIVSIGEEALSKVLRERPDDPEVLGLLAKALNRRRQLVEADKVYQRALAIEPDDPELITGLAVVYGNQGDLEKSIPFYERAFAVDEGYPWAVHGYVHLLKRLGRTNEIMPVLDKALKANPKSALINILYGLELQERGNQSLGQSHVEKGKKLFKDVDCEEQSRALRMFLQNDPPSVISLGEEILREDPDNMDIELLVNMARAFTNPQTTIVNMKNMLERDPNNPRIIGALLPMLLQTGNIPEAMKYKEMLETTAPEDGITSVVDMILTRAQPGDLLTSQETRERYLDSTREILRRFPASPHANLLYIEALSSANQIEEAREHAVKVSNTIKMEDIRQHLRFAFILRSIGLSDESKAQYEAASKITESPYENLLVNLVEHTENEAYTEVVKDCNTYLGQNPGAPELYAILGRAQNYTDDENAMANLEMAVQSGNHDAMILLSNILAKEGDEKKSSELLHRTLNSEDLDSITRARCLIGLKQFDEASEILNEHLKVQPGDFLGWYLLALMKRREGKDAVKEVMRTMFRAGVREVRGMDDLHQKVEIDKAVDEVTNAIMIGEIGGKVKHMLLSDQVLALLRTELEG